MFKSASNLRSLTLDWFFGTASDVQSINKYPVYEFQISNLKFEIETQEATIAVVPLWLPSV